MPSSCVTPSGSATNYHRCLDLALAESRTQYDSPCGPVAIRSLVSQSDDVLLVDLSGAGLSSFDDFTLDFASPHPASITYQHRDEQKWLTITGRVPAQVLPNYVEIEPAIFYATDHPDGEGLVDAGMGYAVVAVLQQTETGARLRVAAESGFRGYDQRPSADTERLAERRKRGSRWFLAGKAMRSRQRIARIMLAISTVQILTCRRRRKGWMPIPPEPSCCSTSVGT